MSKQWKVISDVPVNAWFQFISRPSEMFRIAEIRLEYVPMGMTPAACGQAVSIGGTYWRIEELLHVFRFSFDLDGWYSCEGDLPSLGDIDKLGQYVEREAKRQRELINDTVAAVEKSITAAADQVKINEDLAAQVRAVRQEVSALVRTAENTPKPEAKPETEAKSGHKGATPPK